MPSRDGPGPDRARRDPARAWRRTPFWRALRQIGVDRAVGVLPAPPQRLARSPRRSMPWDYVPLAIYQELRRGGGLQPRRDRGQPADGRHPPRPARPRGGARDVLHAACGTWAGSGSRCSVTTGWPSSAGCARRRRARGRGGAIVAGFDARACSSDAPPTAARRVAAEAALGRTSAGSSSASCRSPRRRACRLALHPDDPPLSPIRGIGRIMRSVEAFQRGCSSSMPSPANGITFCQGNFTLMTDDVPAAIRRFGERAGSTSSTSATCAARRSASSRRSTTRARPTCSRACRAYATIGFDGVAAHRSRARRSTGDAATFAGYSDARPAARDRLHARPARGGLRAPA